MGVTRSRRYYNWKSGIKNGHKFSGEKLKLKCSKLFEEKLQMIKNNDKYNNWIAKFNWKIANPYKPNSFMI